MFEELNDSAPKGGSFDMTSNLEDVSAIDFDIQKQDIDKMKKAVRRIVKEDREGRAISRKIMEEMD